MLELGNWLAWNISFSCQSLLNNGKCKVYFGIAALSMKKESRGRFFAIMLDIWKEY